MKVIMHCTTPKPPELPPSPDSPWDDILDGCPQSLTNQMMKDLEKEIETDEWKANALKNNVFGDPGLERPAKLGDKSTPDTGKSSSTMPAVQYSAMNVAPGKRQRLK